MKKRIKITIYLKKRTHKEVFPNENLLEYFYYREKKPNYKIKNEKENEILIISEKHKKINTNKDSNKILKEELKNKEKQELEITKELENDNIINFDDSKILSKKTILNTKKEYKEMNIITNLLIESFNIDYLKGQSNDNNNNKKKIH